MPENLSQQEQENKPYNIHDLTPFELIVVNGSSEDVIIGGIKTFVNSNNIQELAKSEEAKRLFLTPINLIDGEKSLEEIKRARSQEKAISTVVLEIFGQDHLTKNLQENITFVFKLGELDKSGQLEGFEIALLQDGQEIKLPATLEKEYKINKNFDEMIEYVGRKNDVMKFKFK